jgi:hypothetical protein
MSKDLRGPVRAWVQSTTLPETSLEALSDGGRAGPLFTLLIPKTLPSWNDLYIGVHWATRKKLRDTWHDLVLLSLLAQPQPPIPKDAYPLHMVVSVTFYKRRLDCSNLCIKVAEDALIKRVIPNDSPTFISQITLRSLKGEKDKTVIKLYKDLEAKR